MSARKVSADEEAMHIYNIKNSMLKEGVGFS
jgi:hypothetical protein